MIKKLTVILMIMFALPCSAQSPFNAAPILQAIKLPSITAAGSFYFPPNAVIRDIVVQNSTANAITGGLAFGTTTNGTDIVAALTVGASANVFVTDALLLKRFFSITAAQQIFYSPVVSFNSANVTIYIIYEQLY